MTVLAAGAGETETAQRLLGVEAIKGRLDPGLFKMLQHLADSRVRGTGQNIGLIGKGALGGHRLYPVSC